MVIFALLIVLGELPPGVETRSVMINHGLACPSQSQSSFCDDPSVVEPTVDFAGELDKVIFVGRKPGVTMCSCGLNRGFRTVWQITVQTIDEGTEIIARKVLDDAFKRLASLKQAP